MERHLLIKYRGRLHYIAILPTTVKREIKYSNLNACKPNYHYICKFRG